MAKVASDALILRVGTPVGTVLRAYRMSFWVVTRPKADGTIAADECGRLEKRESPETVVGRGDRPWSIRSEPRTSAFARPPLRSGDRARQAHAPTAGCASGVKRRVDGRDVIVRGGPQGP